MLFLGHLNLGAGSEVLPAPTPRTPDPGAVSGGMSVIKPCDGDEIEKVKRAEM